MRGGNLEPSICIMSILTKTEKKKKAFLCYTKNRRKEILHKVGKYQMKWRNLVIAGLAGAVAGYAITKKQTEWLSPEKALKMLKEKANQNYNISGSWILVNREDTNVFGLPYTVYKGGFSHSSYGNAPIHYEFLIDAKTGTLLQLIEK